MNLFYLKLKLKPLQPPQAADSHIIDHENPSYQSD